MLGLLGCQGDPVSAASTDAATTDSNATDSSTTTDSTTLTPDTPAFETPIGDAACVDGRVNAPETGVGGCPTGMVRLPPGAFSALGRSGGFPKGFCIDATEVTTAAYQASCSSGSCEPTDSCAGRTFGVAGKANHPINCVTFEQADAYCKGVGKRLPTEFEWEYAERGAPASGAGNTYPWGNALAVGDTCLLCWEASSGGSTCPVGAFPAGNSPQGVMDLAGSVEEWTTTIEAPGRVRRGGGYRTNDPASCGADYGRGGDVGAYPDRGFRCVKDL